MSADKNNKQPAGSRAEKDAILLQRIADGDRDAFTELYTIFQPRLIKFCSRMLKNDVALAADIADEAMIEVWKSAGTFSGLSQPSTWIHSIARLIREISEMLDVSENTVKTRMFYARKHLKAIVSNEDLIT